jgi:drug/metabolite transporter (DMT)-like permease
MHDPTQQPVGAAAPGVPASGMGDRLAILAAAVLFSTGGAVIKACELGAWQVASYRSGIAALTILALVPASRRGWTGRTWLVGLAYASTLTLYVGANKMTTAASTIFLQGTAPLWVLLLGPWLLGEAIRLKDLLLMLVIASGMALLLIGLPPAAATAPDPVRGNALAALAGVLWGLTIMGLRWLGRDAPGGRAPRGSAPASAVACGNLIACAVGLPWALPAGAPAAPDWLLLVYLGVLQVGLAYIFLTRGVRRVGALETSLLLLLEPVLNPIWAWIAHREDPGAWALAGGGIIMVATVLKTLLDRQPAAVRSAP